MKHCDYGNHEAQKLWRARTKTTPSVCARCMPSFNRERGNVAQPKRKLIERNVTPIKKRSDKLRKEDAVYRKVKKEYIKEHPTCEFLGCCLTSVTLHHMAGRMGSLYTDKRYFKSLCLEHHRWVEENPNKAKKLGLSTTRIDK